MKNLETYVFLILMLVNTPSVVLHAQNKLLIPDTLSGKSITLNLQEGKHVFYTGFNTKTIGVNGDILGPTLFLDEGDSIFFNVKNSLNDTTTIHWHGLHVSPSNDGGPHTFILPGDTWKPKFRIKNQAATFWYHPHFHHKTDEHVSKGLTGFIIVRDSHEAKIKLPRTYGIDDFPLAIQTKDFDASKEIVNHSNNDDVVLVNATINPSLDVGAQVIRCRILNGSSQRVFNLGLSENRKFVQIAGDGGLLDSPISLTRLMISPGERVEILIDFTKDENQKFTLYSYASELPNGIYGATNPGMGLGMTLTNYNPNSLNGADFKILDFNIKRTTSNAVTSMPTSLIKNSKIPISQSTTTRNLTFSPERMGMNQLNGNFLINNRSFDLDRIDYRIPLNQTEIWSIRNMSGIAHPFHIHDVQFQLLDRNGTLVGPSESGWKDVVLIRPQETVRFITTFETFADTTVPYMFHCHMLTHEDGGMMGQFIVYDTSQTVGVLPVISHRKAKIYPNPVRGYRLYLSNDNITEPTRIYIYSSNGQLIQELLKSRLSKILVIDVPKGLNGVYFVEIVSKNGYHFEKLIINN